MGTRWRVAGAVGIGLILCVAIGAVVIDRMSSETFACSGVGFTDAPSASTAENALAAFLDTRGGGAADWERSDHRTSGYVFKKARPDSGYKFITVQGRSQTWSVTGTGECVDPASRSPN